MLQYKNICRYITILFLFCEINYKNTLPTKIYSITPIAVVTPNKKSFLSNFDFIGSAI